MNETADAAFSARHKAFTEGLEAVLDRLLTFDVQAGEIARPARLIEAMRYAVLGGGKRLRPFLLAETARLFGGKPAGKEPDEGVLRAGAALELVHCYSLAHDDLPAMDDDDFRRGKPSLHRAFDEATAILAGDALLTLAFEILADSATDPDPAVRAALVLGLARAAGLGGMVGGQVFDITGETPPPGPPAKAKPGNGVKRGGADPASVLLGQLQEVDASDGRRRMIRMKTAALFRFAAEAGAIIGRAEPKARSHLADFGEHLGVAFQLADDIADGDAEADPGGLKKSAVLAFVSLIGVEPQTDSLRGLVKLVTKLDPWTETITWP